MTRKSTMLGQYPRKPALQPENKTCADCGIGDMLNNDGVCPSCATERMLDMGEYYDSQADADREWWEQRAYNESLEEK